LWFLGQIGTKLTGGRTLHSVTQTRGKEDTKKAEKWHPLKGAPWGTIDPKMGGKQREGGRIRKRWKEGQHTTTFWSRNHGGGQGNPKFATSEKETEDWTSSRKTETVRVGTMNKECSRYRR